MSLTSKQKRLIREAGACTHDRFTAMRSPLGAGYDSDNILCAVCEMPLHILERSKPPVSDEQIEAAFAIAYRDNPELSYADDFASFALGYRAALQEK